MLRARLNGLMLRLILFFMPASRVRYDAYHVPLAGYVGYFELKSSGRVIAFVEEGGGLMFDWCADNWFGPEYARR